MKVGMASKSTGLQRLSLGNTDKLRRETTVGKEKRCTLHWLLIQWAKIKTLPSLELLSNHPQKEWIRSLTISWSMHSLVHSHCSILPTYCQVTHRCPHTVGLLCTLLPPSVLELALNNVPLTHAHNTCYKAHTAASLAKKL